MSKRKHMELNSWSTSRLIVNNGRCLALYRHCKWYSLLQAPYNSDRLRVRNLAYSSRTHSIDVARSDYLSGRYVCLEPAKRKISAGISVLVSAEEFHLILIEKIRQSR